MTAATTNTQLSFQPAFTRVQQTEYNVGPAKFIQVPQPTGNSDGPK